MKRPLRRRAGVLVGVSVVGLLAAGAGLPASASDPLPALDPVVLKAFFDGVWYGQKAEHDVVGAVVTVVQNGELILNEGYGYADIEARTPVDPERTLFRIASISKLFTWLAIMQLAERGEVDLDADVNTYLGDVRIPDTWDAPVTLRQLMSHSAGFEDLVLDLGRRSAGELEPLGDYLSEHLPERVRPPGRYSSYSNHGTALAAHVVAQVSGKDWSTYIEEELFAPLGMTRTVARHPFPESLRPDLAVAHERKGGAFEGMEFLHWFIYPAGMMSTTGADMARFMTSLLHDGAGLVEPGTFARMHEDSFRPFEGANGWLHGFADISRGGERIYGHGGDLNGFHSELVIFPERGLGVFFSFNSEGGSPASRHMLIALREWLNPLDVPDRHAPDEDAATRQAEYAGVYAPLRRTHSDFSKLRLLLGGVDVGTDDEGYLVVSWPGHAAQYVATDEDRYVSRYEHEELFFHRDADGRVSHMTFGNYAASTHERLAWIDRPRLHQLLFGFVAITMVATALVWPIRVVRQWSGRSRRGDGPPALRLAPGIAWAVSLAVLYSLVSLSSGLQEPSRFYFGIPDDVLRLLALMPLVGLLGLAASAVLLRGAVGSDRALAARMYAAVFASGMAVFVFLGLYWKTFTYYL